MLNLHSVLFDLSIVYFAVNYIGALATNPRKALEDEIDKGNQDGWSAIHIEPHRTTNLFIAVLQLAVLVLTLGLFTWGGGYLVLFEREA